MTVSASDLKLIRTSFDRLRDDLDSHSTEFYEALFRRAPYLRSMFREDLAGQGMKFMTTLGAILTGIEDDEASAARIARICASVVPQQPPTRRAPAFTNARAYSPKYAGVAG